MDALEPLQFDGQGHGVLPPHLGEVGALCPGDLAPREATDVSFGAWKTSSAGEL